MVLSKARKTEEKRFQDYPGLVGIGARITGANLTWDCGACGYPTCADRVKALRLENGCVPGPSCNWISLDLGIACDFAAAMAQRLGVQTRVSDVIGGKIVALGLMEDADVCTALPLSCEARNPQFEARKEGAELNPALLESTLRRLFPTLGDLSPSDILKAVAGHKLSPLLASEITEFDKT